MAATTTEDEREQQTANDYADALIAHTDISNRVTFNRLNAAASAYDSARGISDTDESDDSQRAQCWKRAGKLALMVLLERETLEDANREWARFAGPRATIAKFESAPAWARGDRD